MLTDIAARTEYATKTYGDTAEGVTALDAVSVQIRRGELTAVMGASGSGKSTLMHLMAGLDTPSSGRVFLGDTDLTGMDDRELTALRRRRVGFIFQSFNLVPTLDVRHNIALPFRLDGRETNAQEREWMDMLITRLGLDTRATHRPRQLSGGQQQRVAVARALVTRPDVVFADEPTGNLDSRTGQEVLGLLRDASRGQGQTIVMVTHDPVAASIADRILFLADGRVVAERPASTPAEIAELMLGVGSAR